MLQSRIFVGMVLILIFGEVLGLYGYYDFADALKKVAADASQTHCRPDIEYTQRLIWFEHFSGSEYFEDIDLHSCVIGRHPGVIGINVCMTECTSMCVWSIERYFSPENFSVLAAVTLSFNFPF